MVFARYPEPGKCKTRLIPELGADRAAQLTQEMTERTLQWARDQAARTKAQVQVYFSGGSADAMQQMFGSGEYVPQAAGNLGDRLRAAMTDCTRAGIEQALIVGTDCPDLSPALGSKAWDALDTHELCFAPASDGGYTLLGLRTTAALQAVHDAVVHHIDWGTSRVLQQTLERLESLPQRPAVRLLPVLHDVDTPADLPVWEAALNGQPSEVPRLSVVIPTLHTEPNLDGLLARLQADQPRVEVIVVGAGNWRTSLRACHKYGAQFLASSPGRGQQLNAGAQCALADTLLFVHADCELPAGYLADIEYALRSAQVAGGAFQLKIRSTRTAARWVEKGVAARTKVLRLPYGDQGIFVRRSIWKDLSGFPDQPIMEDYEFVRRLRKRGRLAFCPSHVTTSERRWGKLGYAKTTIINQMMVIGYHLGCSPQSLATFYRNRR